MYVREFHSPATESQGQYNQAHAATKSVIERTFGILKSRFRCLDESGGCLLLSPEKVCRVTVVCCMLHNMASERRLPEPVQGGRWEPRWGGEQDYAPRPERLSSASSFSASLMDRTLLSTLVNVALTNWRNCCFCVRHFQI